jgi:transcriptional regulator with XRE-family HTH domain
VNHESISSRILTLISSHSLTQAALARRAGIDTALLNRKLKGHRRFRQIELEWIAGALGLTLAAIVSGTDFETPRDLSAPTQADTAASS